MANSKRNTKKTSASTSAKQTEVKKNKPSVLGDDMQDVMDDNMNIDGACQNCDCSNNKSRTGVGLILAIIFASAVVSGSLVFFAMQTGASWWPLNNSEATGGDTAFDQRVEAAIERYIQKRQAEQQQAQAQAEQQSIEQSKAKAKNVDPVSKTTDHIYGNIDAPISIIEYSDFQCPYCRRFHPTAKQLVDSSQGQVNWVYRHYPLEGHEPEATQQALASECVAELAGNDAFWAYADVLFNQGPSDLPSMSAEAVKLGVDEVAFKECYESQKHKDGIQSDMKNGLEAGVTGTPGSIVLNNKTGEALLIEGAQSATVFQRYIQELQ